MRVETMKRQRGRAKSTKIEGAQCKISRRTTHNTWGRRRRSIRTQQEGAEQIRREQMTNSSTKKKNEEEKNILSKTKIDNR